VPTTWVVKLGGSLADSGLLPSWLETLVEAKIVLVPGGGPFADRVRWAQARWGFDDTTAHAMAILAMKQYGLMLSGICPKFRTAVDVGGLAAALATGRSAIWLPDPAAIDEREVPASWDVTSDSLAAWLARKAGATHLLLVKSAAIPSGEFRAEALAAEGLIDTAFPRFTAGATFETWLCRREDHDRLGEGLGNPETVFTRVIHGH
jgi:aspartokinase-like uncharacterized kinase